VKGSLKLSSALIALSMFGAGSGTAFAQEAPAAEDDSQGVVDITVTATRRSEAANKIPVAIQALGGDTLSDLGITKLDKLIENLPNVRTASRGPGASSIFIRGLSTDSPGLQVSGTAGAQPTVALYVNDAPASLVGRNLDLYTVDLQRVEVLAGPQGTLFGASAMGGALRYITNKPDLNKVSAGFNASYAMTRYGEDSVAGDAFLNLPIVEDRIGLRVVVYADRQGGYIDNVASTFQMPFNANAGQAGRLPTGNPLLVMRAIQACQQSVVLVGGIPSCGTSGGAYLYNTPTRQTINNDSFVEENYNDATYRGGRAALTFKLSDDWSVDLMHMRQQLDTDGVFDYEPGVGDLQVTKFDKNTLDDKADVTTWTLNGRLGMLDFIYTGSYLNHKADQYADYAGYSNIGLYVPYYECDRGVYYTAAYNGNIGNTCYTPNKSYRTVNKTKRWTHEARITTPADNRIRGTLGVFFDHNKLTDNTDWAYLQPLAGFIYPRAANLGPTAFPTDPNNPGVRALKVGFFNDVKRVDKQFAVYGEASFDIIEDKLTLTVGSRYYNEKASINGSSQTSFATGGRGIYNPGTGTYSPAAVPPTTYGIAANLNQLYADASPATYDGVLWKGNLTYKFGNSLVYATYSDGFRPGGFNRRPCRVPSAICPTNADFVRLGTYVPDKVANYEIGGKFSLLDRRLQINLAAYQINWTDVQMTVFDQNISNQTFTTNLIDAKIKGVEGDITLRATPGLTFNGAFSYNDTSVEELLRNTQVLRPVGSPLALSPKFQFNIRMNYEWEMESGVRPFVNLSMRHVGKSWSDVIDNLDIRYQGFNPTLGYAASTPVLYNGVLVRPGDVIAPLPAAQEMAAHTTFNMALGASKDDWRIELFADNLTDKRAELYTSANDGERRVTVNRPRTIGLRISYKMQ
jgi:iron complex outermembrane receptor protein